MMTITHNLNGFKIGIGTGKTFFARDLDEIVLSVEHYFCLKPHIKTMRNCPLCRE
jgi:hypothetical protein